MVTWPAGDYSTACHSASPRLPSCVCVLIHHAPLAACLLLSHSTDPWNIFEDIITPFSSSPGHGLCKCRNRLLSPCEGPWDVLPRSPCKGRLIAPAAGGAVSLSCRAASPKILRLSGVAYKYAGVESLGPLGPTWDNSEWYIQALKHTHPQAQARVMLGLGCSSNSLTPNCPSLQQALVPRSLLIKHPAY